MCPNALRDVLCGSNRATAWFVEVDRISVLLGETNIHLQVKTICTGRVKDLEDLMPESLENPCSFQAPESPQINGGLLD